MSKTTAVRLGAGRASHLTPEQRRDARIRNAAVTVGRFCARRYSKRNWLKCFGYDYEQKYAELHLTSGTPDMASTITFFEMIDPDVTCILVLSPATEDDHSCYRKRDGKWEARRVQLHQ